MLQSIFALYIQSIHKITLKTQYSHTLVLTVDLHIYEFFHVVLAQYCRLINMTPIT